MKNTGTSKSIMIDVFSFDNDTLAPVLLRYNDGIPELEKAPEITFPDDIVSKKVTAKTRVEGTNEEPEELTFTYYKNIYHLYQNNEQSQELEDAIIMYARNFPYTNC